MNLSQDQIVPIESDNGRTYEVVDKEGDIFRLPSVTTIINYVCNKPALVPWAYNIGVEETFNIAHELDAFTNVAQVKLRLDELKRTHKNRMEEGAARGLEVHKALEAIAAGEDYEFHPEVTPYIVQLKKFIEDYQPEWHLNEYKVASLEHGYAGQFDSVCTINAHPSRRKHESLVGKKVLIDFKTNKEGRVYPETHLPQVEAYSNAYKEMGGNSVEANVVLAIGPKSFQPCVSYARFETFQAILSTYNELRLMKSNNPNKRK